MHDRISFDSLCFPTASLQQVKGYWRELGARRVSILAMQLTSETVGEVKEILASGPFKLETIAGHIFVQGPLSRRQEDWVEPRARLNVLIDLAAEVGAHSIYMLTGGHGSLTWEEGAQCFSQAIAPCVEHAAHAGVALCIETASWVYADIHLAHTLRDAITLTEMAGIGINLLKPWPLAVLVDSVLGSKPFPAWLPSQLGEWGQPAQITAIGRSGSSHIQLAALQKELNLPFGLVHFEGSGKAYPAVMGGHVDAAISGPGSGSRMRDSLHFLAVTGAEREKALPDVPTLKELGFNVTPIDQIWYAMTTPKVPDDRIAVLSNAFAKAFEDKMLWEQMQKVGEYLKLLTRAQVEDMVRKQAEVIDRYKDLLG